jgi:preprotein translocase subunit SecD
VATKRPHPWRSLGVLLLVLVVGFGTMIALGALTPRLGLDLRGGTSITLTARPSAGQGPVTQEKLAEAVDIIRNRVGAIAEAEVTTQGNDHIVVEVPGVGQDEIVRLVGSTAELRFRQVLAVAPAAATAPTPTPTPSGSPSQATSPTPTPSASPSVSPHTRGRAVPQALEAAAPTPTRSSTPSPTSQPNPPTPDNGKVQVSTTGATPEQLAALDKFKCDQFTPAKDNSRTSLLTCDRESATKFVLGPALILGSEIADASAQLPQNQLSWQVGLQLKGAGKSKFAQASTQMYQLQQPLSQFAIVLDGKVVSYPVIQGPITDGQASITGQFSQQDATDLANTLKYGALPLTF